ncbi:MAG TPA: hypothetical protein PKZ49_11955 [Nitrosomonas sp.]|nr:hypothetical protein [Nitrosomonas sp.]
MSVHRLCWRVATRFGSACGEYVEDMFQRRDAEFVQLDSPQLVRYFPRRHLHWSV